jgi:hypothetical protein
LDEPDVVEPPIDRDATHLSPGFRRLLAHLMADLQAAGQAFKIAEGLRTPERQSWLYASGRTRPGPILTQKDGSIAPSRHQSGNAADLYPCDSLGRITFPIPPATDPVWLMLRRAAERLGLGSGGSWGDWPHVEL